MDSDGYSDDEYDDTPGFYKSATLDEIAEHGFVFIPGRYFGAEDVEDDGVPFAEKVESLTRELATKWRQDVAHATRIPKPDVSTEGTTGTYRRDDRNHLASNSYRPCGALRACSFSDPRVYTRGYNMPIPHWKSALNHFAVSLQFRYLSRASS